jgi:hypothetical protein
MKQTIFAKRLTVLVVTPPVFEQHSRTSEVFPSLRTPLIKGAAAEIGISAPVRILKRRIAADLFRRV